MFLPSCAHKMPLTFPSVYRVGFHVCNTLHETKGQMWKNNKFFSAGNILFECKINISQQLGKKIPFSTARSERDNADRDTELPVILVLGSHETSVKLLQWVWDFTGAEKKALRDSCGRKILKGNCGLFIGMSVVVVRFQCKTFKMRHSSCQVLSVVLEFESCGTYNYFNC